ncbi:glycosyltransferase family 4 protein [Chryseobacterium arthrosphaerae]|uniref:glycosyltransferase family 4 protein n=2 Tax=Chryseobacterium arthrosphaerae TaxID=651561 RepID=UPI001BAF931D|nr:glycosyltransferase family 4 protein [Chryseobacterium arthrosphaerae]QUY54259.1 glycosyltransferase family 4 protein [Chryseobacterium arthrosphaerae]UEQ78731.1 glycosyltransferase family 4 protein [Chryseobacterium arthrosphaerae]
MRFVHVEDFVHPNAGYQINLLTRLQVQQGHEVIIVAGELDKIPVFLTSFFGKDNIEEKDRKFEEETGVKIIRHPLYAYYSGRAIYKPGLHKLIKSLNPDVLFIHNEDTVMGMKLLWDYKKMNVPYVLDCHMLEMASENRFRDFFRLFYRKFVTPVILKNNIPLIRVVDTDFVQKHYNIPLSKTKLLSFGTDTDFYKPDSKIKEAFRKELGIDNTDFVVIYAGKMDPAKGGEFLAESLKEKIKLEGKNLKFIIIGNPPKDEYGEKVEKLFSQSENNIIRFPTQTYFDLAKFYQIADIAIFPKQCSMSYFEVQSCELPVVLEENEINNLRVSDKKGLLFPQSSISEFRSSIEQFGNMPKEEFEIYKRNARKNIVDNYNFVPIAQQFTDIMIEEYEKFHSK